jgi:DNA-binding IclR family transcriptional regulator
MSKIVERTLDFLELFAKEKKPLTLSDLSRLLKIPVSSCHDLLRALQSRGYVYEVTARGGYYPTLRMHNLMTNVMRHDPVAVRAEEALRELRDEIDESVSLAKVSGALKANYLLVFEPSHQLRFLVTVGDEPRSLYATSAGKAVLGGLSRAAFEEYLVNAKLVPMTKETITSKVKLRKEIRQGIERGWFINREETVIGVTTISARFEWGQNTYIVTVSGPTSRMESELERTAELLLRTCGRLAADA